MSLGPWATRATISLAMGTMEAEPGVGRLSHRLAERSRDTNSGHSTSMVGCRRLGELVEGPASGRIPNTPAGKSCTLRPALMQADEVSSSCRCRDLEPKVCCGWAVLQCWLLTPSMSPDRQSPSVARELAGGPPLAISRHSRVGPLQTHGQAGSGLTCEAGLP